ncbi:tail fiber protein [Yersinia phage vB_Yru_GN1]|uniref:Tail fiber protein n=1 Tax=Yersinia phage vB_Yru_GN1 TaxID=3074381 RepID=A0AA86J574_9CAUD|nr:tail fiber protein [Yersinia phage vB_Yru_GN1]
MAGPSKNLLSAIGRTISIPDGTDLMNFLSNSDTGIYHGNVGNLINLGGLPNYNTRYQFNIESITASDKRVEATEATGPCFINVMKAGVWTGWIMNYSDKSYPVGVPIPFPGSTPPSGFALCNGQSFDKISYPKLASVYPNGVIPDLRGEFIRGWDGGRGVDAGRVILSTQQEAAPNITGTMYDMTTGPNNNPSGVFTGITLTPNMSVNTGSTFKQVNLTMDASRSSPTYGRAAELRPRNIAYNYIVRMT